MLENIFISNSSPPQPSKGEISRAKELALTILDAAREDASRIVSQAESLSEALRKEAEITGYAEGVARGIGQLISAAEERVSTVMHARQKIVDLSIDIARSVVGREIEERPESILSRVEAALTQFRASPETTLRLHPDDVGVVDRSLPQIQNLSIRTLKDTSIGRGSFVLRNSSGELRADLGDHLGRLQEALMRSEAGA